MNEVLADAVRACLSIYREPTGAEVSLWVLALQPFEPVAAAALAEWVRSNDDAPTPAAIVRLIAARRQPTKMRSIAELVAVQHGVTFAELVGPMKPPHLVAARRDAVGRMRAEGFSTAQIGRALNRDASSIRHLAQQFAARCRDDGRLNDSGCQDVA